LKEQSRFFNEEKVKMEVEAARRLLVPDTRQEVGNESREDKSEEAILDVQSVLVEEMEGIVEKEAHSNEAKLRVESETEEEMDGNKEKEADSEELQVDIENETEEEMHGNKEKEANSEEAKRDVENEMKQEMDGNKEKEVNSEEARREVQNEENYGVDDDVTRKDRFYDTEENDEKVARFLLPRASVELLLFIGVIVGLVVTWYASKLQRKRTGLHKKLDVAASYRPGCLELGYC
jgi:hypothetical protein